MSIKGLLDHCAEVFLEGGDGMTREDRQWHLDKKVIVGLIFGFLSLASGGIVQTIYFTNLLTQWKTMTDDRITSLEKSDSGQQSHEGRIIILEQQFSYIRSDLTEIKDLLRRSIPNGKQP